MTWGDIQQHVASVTAAITRDGSPEAIVAIARGGLIPAVLLAHRFGCRDLRTLNFTHTTTDAVHADKTTSPVLTGVLAVDGLAGRDVLLVDDIAGSGDTLAAARHLLSHTAAARRLRTVVLVVNTANWTRHQQAPTYVGHRVEGWVTFPWEQPTST
ncbi:phosphoribosyltransferase [Actinomadura harenae]|uniref:phosphoribosyltransferase n=1 Tax=Actinomadura harenae TaxID=2483351 RepID=UPI0018F35F6A|nr:phosphoribosyltransferase family protein [Actinomadura harenae]